LQRQVAFIFLYWDEEEEQVSDTEVDKLAGEIYNTKRGI
jgi:hypothetical protein